MKQSTSTLPTLTLHATVLVWAATALFAKIIPLPAADIIQLRSIPALIVLSIALVLLKISVRLALVDWIMTLMIGFITAVHWVSFYQAVQLSSVAIGLITLYTYPLFTSLLEPVIHHRKPTKSQITMAVIGLAGIAIVSLESFNNSTSLLAIAYGLLASLAFTARNLLSKYKIRHVPSILQMWIQIGTTLLVLTLFLGIGPIKQTSFENWVLLAILGIFFVALPHTLFLYTLKHIDAAKASLMSMIQPAYAIALAAFFLKEWPTIYELSGGILIMATATWATRENLK